MILVNLVLFLIACVVLALSGSLLVRTLVKISAFLHISEYIIGFVLMAFATSIPELFVGITSAIAKNPGLAVGTVIGSNILDLTLVMGLVIVLARKLKVETKIVKKDSGYMFFIVILPLILMYIGSVISRIDGAILIIVFILYSYILLKKRKRFSKEIENKVKRWDIVIVTILFIFSLATLFISANYVVFYATMLSFDLVLPPIFIGLFLISLGTSLPELVFETKSVLSRHPEMALGDAVGSVIVNSTLVLGVTALITPIISNLFLFYTSALFMIVVVFIFSTFTNTTKYLNWRHGVSLVILYVFFLIIELNLKGIILIQQ